MSSLLIAEFRCFNTDESKHTPKIQVEWEKNEGYIVRLAWQNNPDIALQESEQLAPAFHNDDSAISCAIHHYKKFRKEYQLKYTPKQKEKNANSKSQNRQ